MRDRNIKATAPHESAMHFEKCQITIQRITLIQNINDRCSLFRGCLPFGATYLAMAKNVRREKNNISFPVAGYMATVIALPSDVGEVYDSKSSVFIIYLAIAQCKQKKTQSQEQLWTNNERNKKNQHHTNDSLGEMRFVWVRRNYIEETDCEAFCHFH